MYSARGHLVFSPAAAHALSHALAQVSCSDTVLCLTDDFSFGPIASDERKARIAWVEQVLRLDQWNSIVGETDDLVAALAEDTAPIIAWVSRRDVRTYAGFLWFLEHVGPSPVLLADARFLRDAHGLMIIRAIDRADPLLPTRRCRHLRHWQTLKEEDAPFRVIDNDRLVSAPIDHFDANLIGHASRAWQRMARIIGNMFADFECSGAYQTCDGVLAARLATLSRTGRLEWQGNLADLANCMMRLPRAQGAQPTDLAASVQAHGDPAVAESS